MSICVYLVVAIALAFAANTAKPKDPAPVAKANPVRESPNETVATLRPQRGQC